MYPSIAAAFITAFLLFFLRRPAIAMGFVDKPGGRKQHEDLIPPIGGLVIFPVAIIAALAFGYDYKTFTPFALALLLLVFTGAVDDRAEIPPSARFVIQIIAATLIVIPGGAAISNLGDMFGMGKLYLGYFEYPFFIFCMVLLINAMNMIDGLDGLSGGVATVMLTGLAILSGSAGALSNMIILWAIIGALVGFLAFNMRTPLRKKASIFIGDSGSLALGVCLGWLCINAVRDAPQPGIEPMAIAWILAFPVMDAFALFTKRLSERRHPFSADRYHVHYILKDSGLSVSASVWTILILNMINCAVAWYINTYVEAVWPFTACWLLMLLIHTAIVFNSHRVRDVIKKMVVS